ncbi:MAG: hypothetical protein WD225_06130, partial [Ilumatobacteraceae bacterium]
MEAPEHDHHNDNDNDQLPTHRLYETMATSHGVVDQITARDLDVSRRTERGLLAAGVLRSPATGVLVATAAPKTWAQRALSAVRSPGRAVLSHGAAARLHGLDGFDRYDLIDVICKKGSWPQPPPRTITHHTRGLTDADITEVARIPTLTVASTLTLLAPTAGLAATAKALDSALRHGHTIEELREVATRWRRRGRPGPPALLHLLDERDGRTLPRSWFQRLAKRLFARTGVRFVDEHPVTDGRGTLLAELDLADPRRLIGVECQSWRWHATPEAQHRDARRKGMLRRMGWEIVDVWWRDLAQPARVEAEIAHLVATRTTDPTVRGNRP